MDFLNNTILLFINILHILIILLILIIPFTSSNYLLTFYIVMVPFILLHWVLNDNTCCLTLMEQKIRERINGEPVDKSKTYMHKLISPIYDFNKNNYDLSSIIYVITILLWSIALYGLYDNYKNNRFNKFSDIFIF